MLARLPLPAARRRLSPTRVCEIGTEQARFGLRVARQHQDHDRAYDGVDHEVPSVISR